MHFPEGKDWEDLSTVGLGSIMCGQGLFQNTPTGMNGLGLALSETGGGNGEWVLIYGGSTAT